MFVVRRRCLTLLIVGGALALSACGGGSKPPVDAAYRAQANAICRTARAQTGSLVNQLESLAPALVTGGANVSTQLSKLLRQLQTATGAYLAQLEKLPQPASDRAAIERFLTPLAAVVGAIGQAARDAASGRLPQVLDVLQRSTPTAQDAENAARADGLQQCVAVLPSLA